MFTPMSDKTEKSMSKVNSSSKEPIPSQIKHAQQSNAFMSLSTQNDALQSSNIFGSEREFNVSQIQPPPFEVQ